MGHLHRVSRILLFCFQNNYKIPGQVAGSQLSSAPLTKPAFAGSERQIHVLGFKSDRTRRVTPMLHPDVVTTQSKEVCSIVQQAGVKVFCKGIRSSSTNGFLNKCVNKKFSLWDSLWRCASQNPSMYGELLALVFIEMADAQVLADQANSLPDRQREEVNAQLTHNFIDPMLKYFDLVDASLLVDALLNWGSGCIRAGAQYTCLSIAHQVRIFANFPAFTFVQTLSLVVPNSAAPNFTNFRRYNFIVFLSCARSHVQASIDRAGRPPLTIIGWKAIPQADRPMFNAKTLRGLIGKLQKYVMMLLPPNVQGVPFLQHVMLHPLASTFDVHIGNGTIFPLLYNAHDHRLDLEAKSNRDQRMTARGHLDAVGQMLDALADAAGNRAFIEDIHKSISNPPLNLPIVMAMHRLAPLAFTSFWKDINVLLEAHSGEHGAKLVPPPVKRAAVGAPTWIAFTDNLGADQTAHRDIAFSMGTALYLAMDNIDNEDPALQHAAIAVVQGFRNSFVALLCLQTMSFALARPSEPVYWEDKQKRECDTSEFVCELGAAAYFKVIAGDVRPPGRGAIKLGTVDISYLLCDLDMCQRVLNLGIGCCATVRSWQHALVRSNVSVCSDIME